MELHIGQKLKKFRRDKDLTQEEVAKHLGISFQSISKWERGDGYPDITMLPALANYLEITVDELIGMDEIAASGKQNAMNRTWEENRQKGKHQENVTLMKDALKTYPNNARFLVQLSSSLERLEGTAAEKHEYLRQSIEVQEQIIHYSPDSEIRGAVLFNISDAYHRYGNDDKALEYAYKLPNLYKTRENALVHILKDQIEKRKVAESAIEPLTWSLALHLQALSETNKTQKYTAKIEKILDILFEGNENDFVKSIRAKVENAAREE